MSKITAIPRNYKEMQKICDSCIAQHGQEWTETHCHKCNVSFVRDSLDNEVIQNIMSVLTSANNIKSKKKPVPKKSPQKTEMIHSMFENKKRFQEEEEEIELLETDESDDGFVFSGISYNSDYYDE